MTEEELKEELNRQSREQNEKEWKVKEEKDIQTEIERIENNKRRKVDSVLIEKEEKV